MKINQLLTRRRLFQGAGAAFAAAFLRKGTAFANEPAGPVMNRLSAYMSEAKGAAIPAEVIEKAKQHILDTFAAMISGSELAPGRAAIQFARAYGGQKIATVDGNDLAYDGGILNCITWNIYTRSELNQRGQFWPFFLEAV